VATGVFALLVVRHGTDNELLASLAFGIGFIASTLANSAIVGSPEMFAGIQAGAPYGYPPYLPGLGTPVTARHGRIR
jgi:hypothetical protein